MLAMSCLIPAIWALLAFSFVTRGGGIDPGFITLIAVLGGAALLCCLLYVLAWANERIELTDQEILWFDRLGRVRVRSPIGGIVPNSLEGSQPSTVGMNGAYTTQSTWRFRTVAGEVRFSTKISDCSVLLSSLEKLGAMEGVGPNAAVGIRHVFSYHNGRMVMFMLFTIPFLAMISYVTVITVTGQSVDKNGQVAPPWFALPFDGFGLLLLGFFIFALLTFKNERIGIAGDRICWIDRMGKQRVFCGTSDVVPGSFREIYGGRGYYRYTLGTRDGTIKFDQNIGDCAKLIEVMKAISDGTYMRSQDPGQEAAKSHWSSDPLSEPGSPDIPIS